MNSWRILEGDCRDVLRSLDAGSVHTCVTSPPYFGLRDYGQAGQIGLEPTPDEFVAALVGVFRGVRRVLRDDGTVWLNLGDSYNNRAVVKPSSHQQGLGHDSEHLRQSWAEHRARGRARLSVREGGLKEKDLIGIPWMVAFALRADGWYLRSEIIWAKRNCMPESVTDRPTKAHEQIFLLSKRPSYYYDHDAIREESDPEQAAHDQRYAKVYDGPGTDPANGQPGNVNNGIHSRAATDGKANKRSVWRVASTPFKGAHFATFPPKLIEPCILAGAPERACGECGAPWVRVVERTPMVVRPTPKREAWQAEDDHARTQTGGTMLEPPTSRTVGFEPSCSHADGSAAGVVLDPFAGAGTTGMVALRHNRSFVGVELNPEYAQLARNRIVDDAPLLNSVAEAA